MPVLDLLSESRTDRPAPDHSSRGCPTLEEVAVIARHEHLTLDEAAVRGTAMLREIWGQAAMRQMVWDTLADARRRGDEVAATGLADLYRRTCRRHPSRYDRRRAPTRLTHPFPCPQDL